MRIAFMMAQQHLIIAGGIGQFAKAFMGMAKDHDWEVDFILDKYDSDRSMDLMRTLPTQPYLFTPDKPLGYGNHQECLENRHKDGLNFEREINFRQSLFKALQCGRKYDFILCNTPEAILPVYALGLTDVIPTMYYTHNENFVSDYDGVGPFSHEYDEVYRNVMKLPRLLIGTQSLRNVEYLKKHYEQVFHLPMPLADFEVAEDYNGPKEGVLFVGRWEDRKNPELFVKVVKDLQCPVKVMTNALGKSKFEAALKEAGIQKYEIFTDVFGKAKADLIKSSTVFFNPSKKESFSYATLECLGHCHVVTLDDYDWQKGFTGFVDFDTLSITSKKGVRELIQKKLQTPATSSANALRFYHGLAVGTWIGLFLGTLRDMPYKRQKSVPQLKKTPEQGVASLW
jgi:glycosyltransferase involved in cell wall biosynthesis